MSQRTHTRSVFRRTTAVALVLAMAPALASAYAFSEVRIEGAERIEPATILTYADISRGETVSGGDLNSAVQRLLASGLFETVDVVPQGSTLVIQVTEFPTINVINFEGNRRIKDDELAEIVESQSRRVFSPATARTDAARISQVYASRGRLAARVTPQVIRRDGNRVDLVFEVAEGDVTEIERIGFVGNRAFSDRKLRQVLETKQAGILRTFIRRDTFAPERIPLDQKLLSDFYLSQGYADFKVQAVAPEIVRERDAVTITFAVDEGPRYRFGTVNVTSEVPNVDLSKYKAQVRVARGEVYNPTDIDTTIRRMETIALRDGLDFVNIEPRISRNMRNQTLDLTFAITRGQRIFVERIDIEGNTATLDRVIRRQFRTVEGDPFNPREIRNAAERIRALGFFADAQVDSRTGTSPEQVIVDVNVEEQATGSLSFGASYGRSQGVGFNAGLTERNFLGRGQQLAVNVTTASDDRDISFSFTEPYFLDRDLRFGVAAFYRTTERQNANYDTEIAGVSTNIGFPVSENGRLDLIYRLSRETVENVSFSTSTIIQQDEGEAWSSSIGYNYNYDSRRLGLDPETAYKFSFGQDFAGVGGDVKSVTSRLNAGVESRAWRQDVVLLAEFEAGGVTMLDDGTSRVIDRFQNGTKVRGYTSSGIGPRDVASQNDDPVGGNYYWVLRAEARFPLGLPEEYNMEGGLFADVGSVWGLDDSLLSVPGSDLAGSDEMNVRGSVGVSLFWSTPIGPLRFNYALPFQSEDYDEEQRFDFSISTTF